VRYPGTKKNIVESGMVEDNIRIDGNKVSFTIKFPHETDPFARSVVRAAEASIKTYVSKDIEVNITVARAEEPKKSEPILPNIKNIIAVSSGKGGVGKSTVAANLAVALATKGLRVGLLDADIFGPSMPKMFHLEGFQPFGETVGDKQLIIPAEKYNVKMLSIGFFVNPDTATLWRGAMASNALRQLIFEADWGDLDYFILDTPPGTSDIHLTLLQSVPVTGAVIVSTPQQVALADARKGIDMYQNDKVNVPILGLVENMSWFTPAELPENKYYIFGRGGVKRLAEEMKVPLLGEIPLVQSVCESGDEGIPAVIDTDSVAGRAFAALADRLVEATDKRNRELPPTVPVGVR
jgi:ATP-binding protein involved in chromosome partitioning